MSTAPERFELHLGCTVEAQCEVYETFRTDIDDEGVVWIVKNTSYEVTSLTWFCHDHCVEVEAPPKFEWNT